VTLIYHLAEPAHWAAAQDAGEYTWSTRGATLAEQGFVHCSLAHQVSGVARAVYPDVPDLVLLTIDPDRVGAEVRFEPGEPGEPGGPDYPHVYGPIPVAAVTAATPARRDPDGGVLIPPA
jgi:uncharacterized protein (DUF952 family)